MSSIIQDLQIEATDPNVSVSDLLRKAKIVAIKLDLKEFGEWIEKELNGYHAASTSDLPLYRIVSGEPKAYNLYHGWQSIIFNDPKHWKLVSKRGVIQSIGELDDLARTDSSTFMMGYSGEAKKSLMDAIGWETDVMFSIGRNATVGVLNAVRNLILDWALKLEKAGVVGEGISFSKNDKEIAQVANTAYNIGHIENFAGTIGNISDYAKVSIQQVNGFSVEKVIDLVEQIQKFLPEVKLKSGENEDIKLLIKEVNEEIAKEIPEQLKIKTALSSMKTIFEGVAGNVIAQGIIVGLVKLLS